jgi:hypothetical protein
MGLDLYPHLLLVDSFHGFICYCAIVHQSDHLTDKNPNFVGTEHVNSY